jgi:hypothetical protein
MTIILGKKIVNKSEDALTDGVTDGPTVKKGRVEGL